MKCDAELSAGAWPIVINGAGNKPAYVTGEGDASRLLLVCSLHTASECSEIFRHFRGNDVPHSFQEAGLTKSQVVIR